MAIKNAKAVKTAYKQLDHHIEEILSMSGSLVMSSVGAWDKFSWTRKYFVDKPKEGYFIWIKEQPDCSFLGCVSLDKPGTKQQLNNLTVIEAGLYVDLTGTCESATLLGETQGNDFRSHQARGKLVLRTGSSLYYRHLHDWDKNDQISTNYEFFLEEGASLEYTYRIDSAAAVMNLQARMHLAKGARSDFKILADCQETKVNLTDIAYLEGAGANAISTLRLVGRKNAEVKARSQIIAQAVAKGHLDCAGLMLDKSAKLTLIPELLVEDQNAQLTHEASIGKLSAEQILYLRSRGLSAKEAEDLILRGFLSE
ncbi:MAG: SufD family Fe-S cluster assembly protein [Candidatus Pacebacteria bacterium]|nr:SufD family Fe-S cluster assembly protein [Candidatus Paceibacterota bacterium]